MIIALWACTWLTVPVAGEEIAGPAALEAAQENINNIEEFNLPQSDIGRTIIIIDKIKETPGKYPRKPGTPSKEPIK